MWTYLPSRCFQCSPGSPAWNLDTTSSEDFKPSATSRTTPTPKPSSCPGCGTDLSTKRRSGTTSRRSTLPRGLTLWTSSLADSRARICRRRVGEKEYRREPAPAFGSTWRESFARLGNDGRLGGLSTFWSKMSQGYCQTMVDGRLEPFCATWPTPGLMQSGTAFLLPTSEPPTSENESGLLPTPAASSYGTNQGGGMGRTGPLRPSLESMARRNLWPTPRAEDSESCGAHRGKPDTLTSAVKMWPTPRGTEGKNGLYQRDGGERGKERPTLTGAVRLWPTPMAQDSEQAGSPNARHFTLNRAVKMWPTPNVPNGGRAPKGGMTKTGMTPDGKKRQVGLENRVKMESPHTPGVTGQLNPSWVELLMGYPKGWTILDEAAARWFKAMRKLRGDFKKGQVQRPVGGLESFHDQKILRADLRQHARNAEAQELSLAGQEAQEDGMRGVRSEDQTPRSPCGPESDEQRTREPSDALHPLSPLSPQAHGEAGDRIASDAFHPWAAGWEDGTPRVDAGVPFRVDRLRCCGNGVVPHSSAAWAWARILQIQEGGWTWEVTKKRP